MADPLRLAFVRGIHTLIYVVLATSTFVLMFAEMTGAHGWWLWAALALLAAVLHHDRRQARPALMSKSPPALKRAAAILAGFGVVASIWWVVVAQPAHPRVQADGGPAMTEVGAATA